MPSKLVRLSHSKQDNELTFAATTAVDVLAWLRTLLGVVTGLTAITAAVLGVIGRHRGSDRRFFVPSARDSSVLEFGGASGALLVLLMTLGCFVDWPVTRIQGTLTSLTVGVLWAFEFASWTVRVCLINVRHWEGKR